MFDINKPYRRRDGHEAKVLSTMPDGRLCGCYLSEYGRWASIDWDVDGMLCTGAVTKYDLVNVAEKRTMKVWIAVSSGDGGEWQRFYGAKPSTLPTNCIACREIEITFEVGEGLESNR